MKCQAAGDEICHYIDNCFCSNYEYSPSLKVFHEECELSATIKEMFEEAEAQKLLDCQNEMQRMELGHKVLKCKVCSQKDATDSKAGVSTSEVSNMVPKSLKKKRDDISHNGTGQGVHAIDDNITFSP